MRTAFYLGILIVSVVFLNSCQEGENSEQPKEQLDTTSTDEEIVETLEVEQPSQQEETNQYLISEHGVGIFNIGERLPNKVPETHSLSIGSIDSDEGSFLRGMYRNEAEWKLELEISLALSANGDTIIKEIEILSPKYRTRSGITVGEMLDQRNSKFVDDWAIFESGNGMFNEYLLIYFNRYDSWLSEDRKYAYAGLINTNANPASYLRPETKIYRLFIVPRSRTSQMRQNQTWVSNYTQEQPVSTQHSSQYHNNTPSKQDLYGTYRDGERIVTLSSNNLGAIRLFNKTFNEYRVERIQWGYNQSERKIRWQFQNNNAIHFMEVLSNSNGSLSLRLDMGLLSLVELQKVD